MPTPSLLIVPARFKTGRLYSQIPTNTDNRGDFTVTRNTTATRFNSAGLIESVASGIPRLDYYTSGGVTGCPALLVEPAGTNLKPRSDNFTSADAIYTLTRVTSGTTSNVAPLNLPALTVRETTDNGTHSIQIRPDATLVSGSIYTRSFLITTVGRDVIDFRDAGQTNAHIRFNLVSGSILASGANAISGRVINVGTNMYYVAVTFTATATIGRANLDLYSDNTTNSYAGDISKGVNIHFIQYELGSVATSYIPTTAGTGSRSADVISVSGAVSGSIGQTEGTVYIEGVITNYADAAASFITISDNTINNRLEIRKGSPGSISFERESATQSASTSINATGQVNGIFKMAVAYKSGDTAFFINGVQVATTNAATFTMNTLTHIYLGSNASGTARRLNDRIRAAALYTTRLTNAELATLTTP